MTTAPASPGGRSDHAAYKQAIAPHHALLIPLFSHSLPDLNTLHPLTSLLQDSGSCIATLELHQQSALLPTASVMKLLTFTSALFVVVAAGALVVAAPSVEDAQGISLRNDIDSRGVLTFHPRGCNPPCRGCYKCALCDYGRPCCKRMSPKCPKAGAETINEAAVTEKRAAVDQAMSRREPVLLHARACTPGCK
jgi:hypothetical protein